MVKKYLKLEKEIKSVLKKHNTSYEPYNFSLNKKLDIANDIKTKINENIPKSNFKIDYEISEQLRKFKDTGILQIEKPFLSHKQLLDIHNFLKNENAYPAHIPYYDKYHALKNPYQFKGKILSFNTNTIIRTPHVIELLSSDRVLNIVSNYLGTTPTLFDLNIIFSFGDEEKYHETQHFHRDHDDFHHCLLMVYLNDVDEDSGGHIYAQKSHQSNYLSSSISPTVRENDSVSDIYDEKDDFNMEIVLGNKGTGFISDANGLHSGSVPKIGKRRMIFWARFGLGPNYMWEHHNHQYWGYDPLLVKKKTQNNNFNTDYIFRLFTESYDISYAKSHKTKGDGCMRKTVKYGWNIGVYGNNYFAMSQADGDVRIENYVNENDSLNEVKKKLKGKNILVDNDELRLIKTIQKSYAYPQPTLLQKDYRYHNILGLNSMFYAFLTTQDVDLGDNKILKNKFLKSKSIKRLKLKIKISLFINFLYGNDIFMNPVLIDDQDMKYNIVGYKNKFFALRKDAGSIDIVDLYQNPEKYSLKFLESRSLSHLKILMKTIKKGKTFIKANEIYLK